MLHFHPIFFSDCQQKDPVEAGKLDALAVKISRCPAGARLSWKPPLSTAEEITYTVSLAAKRTLPTQSVESLSYIRVYCGPSPNCTVPNSALFSAHIDRTTKPPIIFRIAAQNEKGNEQAVQVMWAKGKLTTYVYIVRLVYINHTFN